MKNKLSLLLLLLALTVSIFAACTPEKEEDNDTDAPSYNTGASVFEKGTQVYIMMDNSIEASTATKVANAILSITGVYPKIMNTDEGNSNYAPVGTYEHEIIIGKPDAQIVRDAYAAMNNYLSYAEDEIESDDKVAGYSVYSDGSSIVLAYTDDIYGVTFADAIDYLVEEYFGDSSVKLENGYSDTVAFSLYDRLEQIDNEYLDKAWTKLGKFLDDEVIAALKELSALYTDGAVTWLANLYESYICTCGTEECQGGEMCGGGGFYYANTGRDNVGFLPDIDSTYQALTLVSHMGMQRFDFGYGKGSTPEWMKQQIVQFVKMRQNPNGFFYHPQWTKEQVDAKLTRRGRDLDRAVALLSTYGAKPTYDTPIGTNGDGLLWDGTPVGVSGASYLTSPLTKDPVSAVSKIVATSSTAIADNLKTKEALASYLAGLEEKVKANEANAYSVNNELANQNSQVLAREAQLKEQNADWSPCEMIIDYLNRTQNKETGTWSSQRNYNAVDAMFKAAHVYTAFNQPYPNAKKAALFAVETITSSQATSHICNIYNCWCSIDMLMDNIRKFGDEADAQEVQDTLMSVAADGIRATLKKYLEFRKVDGSFSYYKDKCSAESQGMQLCLATNEGDMNATSLCHSVWNTIFACFGLSEYEVPLHTSADYARYIDILEKNSGVIKNDPIPSEPVDFEDDLVGSAPTEVTYDLQSNGATLFVVEDKREGASGNVLELSSMPGKGDIVYVPCNVVGLGSCFVFEGDFCVEDAKNSYIAQINVGASCYMLNLMLTDAKDENGNSYKKVKILESSSQGSPRIENDLGISARLGEWFNIRIEYYLGSHDSVRIKVYFNGELAAVTDNYYDHKGTKITTGTGNPNKYYSYTQINVMSDQQAVILMDNLYTDKTEDTYTPAHDLNNQPLINIDPPNRDEVIYDFEDISAGKNYPSDFTVSENEGTLEVIDGEDNNVLHVSQNKGKGASLYLPAVTRTRATNCAVVEIDVTVASGAVGSSLNLKLNANNLISGDTGAITAFNIEIIEIDGKSYAVLTEAPGGVSINAISTCAAELGATMRLRLEYYEDTNVTLIYVYDNVNDKFVLCASSDILSSGGGVRKFQRLTLSVNNDSVIDLTLDNIKAERIVKSFTEATIPDKEEIIYDFDKVTEGITYPESSVITEGTDKLLCLSNNGASISVPVNYRAVVYNFVGFNANISHAQTSSKHSYRIAYCDKDGNVILAYDLIYMGGRIFIHEHTEYGTSEVAIASFAASEEARLTIEYFDRNDVTNIYYDGSCIAVSSIVYSAANSSLVCDHITVTALSGLGSLKLDDIAAESYNKVCKKETVKTENAEDNAEKLTFESSSTGSIPSAITTKFSSVGAELRIEQMLDKLGKTGKVLAFDSTSDAGDYMYVGVTKEDESYNAIIFEADLAFNKSDGKAISYQLFFEDMKGSGASRLYLTSIEYSSSSNAFTIKDYSGGSSSTTVQVDGQDAKLYRNDGTAVKYTPEGDFRDWFTLRIELYEGSRNEMRIKTYINDTLVYITNNFYNSHAKDEHAGLDLVKKVSILALSSCEATMYLDNASLIKTTKELEADAAGVTTKLFPTVNTPVIIIPPAPVDPNEKIPEVMDFEDEKIYSNTTVEDRNGSNWPTLEVIDGKLNFLSDGGDYIYIKPTVTKGSYTYAVFEADLSFEFNVSETASRAFYTFTVGADNGSSFPTAYRFNIEYNAATGIIKLAPYNNEKTYGTVISKTVGTPGSPTTETTPVKLKIEQYFVNEDVVIVISVDGDIVSIVNSAENQTYKNNSGVEVSHNMFYTYKSDGTGKPYLTMGRIDVNSHSGTSTVMKLDNVTFVQKNQELDKTLIEAKPGSLIKGEAGLGVYHNSIGGYLYNITSIWKEVDLNNANATGEKFIWRTQGGTNDAKAIDADGKSDAGVNDPTKAYSYVEIASYGTNKALVYGQVYSHTRASRLYLKNNDATTGSLYVFETDLVIGSMEGVNAGDAVLSFHLRNNKTETSDFFGNLRIYKNDKGSYSLGYNEYKTYADIESAVWTNIRLEYYHEAGIARYYVNGELVGSERIVTSLDTSSYEFASISLIGSAYDAFVWLDNTVVTATDDEYVRIDGDPDELATVLPVKDGANGVVVLIHDDGDLDTMSILDSVYGKYSLLADVAMVVNRVYDNTAMAPKTSVDSWKPYIDTDRWGLINHSFSHSFWGEANETTLNIDEEKMLLEIVSSGEYLRETFSTERVLTYAYPGFSSVVDTLGHGKAKTYAAAMALIKQNYIAAREYNFPTSNHIGLNLYDLNYAFMGASSISLGEANLAKVLERIDGAATGKLTVLFSHRVVESASEITEGDTSTVPRSYIEAIAKSVSDYAAEGYVWNAHYEDAMLYLKEAESARVSTVQDGDTITVTLTDSLPDEIYNYALTVEIVVPDSWEGVKITQGESVSYAKAFERDGKWIVYADIVPDGGVATVVAESDTTLLPEAPTLPCIHEDKEPVDSVCDVCGREYYDPDTCTHKDADGDSVCDKCETEFTCEHIDASGDDKCDNCDAPYSCPHYDEDINRECDVCGDTYYDPATCVHQDADGDKKCNLCASEFTCEHIDAGGDDKCDNCYAPYSCPHSDSKTEPDRICDICGDEYYDPETCDHKDAASDGVCDNCNTKFTCEHADEDKDGYCDSCTAPYVCPHRDRDPVDSICDKCGEVYHDPATCDHKDEDGDEECDNCGLSTKPDGSIGGVFDDGTAWN